MPLSAGDRLGHYEVLAPIGAGGMGEVYRALDTKLGREVAIKVLPAAFALNAERMARFEREARVLASLNHPNIAAIYGVEDRALVMELIDGPTLADWIAQQPIPLDEALAIASQIADALEAAHEKGIVHRDLKPANVKVRPDGAVKVLDFGLAKVVAESSAEHPENSPTLSIGATEAGMILGTAAYMAPEQVRAKAVDKRADIWAFGCVLYELLTRRKVFEGESTSDVLAAILKSEPDWSRLPTYVPPAIRRLLRRCLEKDPRERLHDIADARIEIGDATQLEIQAAAAPRSRFHLVTWTVVLAAAAAGFALAAWWRNSGSESEPHWTGEHLGGSTVAMGPRISPDGQLLAFQAMVNGITQVAVMKPDSANWTVLTHDESKGFVSEISWSRDGARLYYSRVLGSRSDIYSVPVLGGAERLVLESANDARELPDGSFVVSRLNSGSRTQLLHYQPETARTEPLDALLQLGTATPVFRVAPAGDQIAFLGTPLSNSNAPPHLYALNLASKKLTRLAPGREIAVTTPFAIAISGDGRSVAFSSTAGDLHRIASVPMDGGDSFQPLLTLTGGIGYLDFGKDGAIYADQWDRPRQILTASASGGNVEMIAESIEDVSLPEAVPSPDGRVIFSSRLAGRQRLLIAAPRTDAVPLVETQEETTSPMAPVANDEVAFLIGTAPQQEIAVASIQSGRVVRRLSATRGIAVSSMTCSEDGKTLFYTAGGSVWAVAIDGGQPKQLGAGDAVTLDRWRQELIVRMTGPEGTRLFRMPFSGAPVESIPLAADVRLVSGGVPLGPTAATKDGRLLIQAAAGSTWAWPAGILNLRTGRMQLLSLGYPADVPAATWAPDGKIVMVAEPIRSSLWRFRRSR